MKDIYQNQDHPGQYHAKGRRFIGDARTVEPPDCRRKDICTAALQHDWYRQLS
jgi:hypothetical protein